MCQFVEMMAQGEFLGKSPKEAFDFFDQLSQNSQILDEASPTSVEPNLTTSHVGKYTHRVEDDLRGKMTSLSRKLEALEMKKVNEMYVVPLTIFTCGLCAMVGAFY